MEALRVIKTPKKGKITITLPEELRTRERLEVIVLPAEEGAVARDFDPTQFRGSIKLGMSLEQIDRQCRKMRDEWERGF